MVLRRRRLTLTKGASKVQSLAVKQANRRMRREILPLLSASHPQPQTWNPLRVANGPSAYGVKLWLPDALVMEILRSDDLMAKTTTIVVEETMDAAQVEAKAFVTNIFEQLMSE